MISLHIRVDEELKDEFFDICVKEFRIPSAVLRAAMRDYIKGHKEIYNETKDESQT